MVFSLKQQDLGFSPLQAGQGRIVDVQNEYQIAGAYGTDIFSGQPVYQFTDGNINVLNAAADRIIGVFNGCWYVDTQGNTIFRPYWPASTSVQTGSVVRASLFDGSGIFQVTSDEDTAFADMDFFADLAPATGTGGSTVTGRSSAKVDYSNKDESLTADNVVRMLSRSTQPGEARLLKVKFARPAFGGDLA